MDKHKILPCPKCGSQKTKLSWSDIENVFVECEICKMRGPATSDFDGTKPAIQAWNALDRQTAGYRDVTKGNTDG